MFTYKNYRADLSGISGIFLRGKSAWNKIIITLLKGLLYVGCGAAVAGTDIVAVPDYGKGQCVSFKQGTDSNPMDYPFGYVCVSQHYCEVFNHRCTDDFCGVDNSRGTQSTMTAVPMLTPVSEILMSPVGVSLKDATSQWCLVRDGAGGFWALDKWRGTAEAFSLENLAQTVVRCKSTDLFSSHDGCNAQ